MRVLVWIVVIVAFIVGYVLVSFFIRKIKTEQSNNRTNNHRTTYSETNGAKSTDSNEDYFRTWQEAEEEKRKEESWNSLSEEQQYANVLGFKGPVIPSDVKKAYRELLAKYHPDKVNHLGDEFRKIAEQKTREIVKAYEYFRRKFNIT